MDPTYCYAWGLGSKGQLACTLHQTKSLNALHIPALQKDQTYLEISCGEKHNLLLTEQLQILSCGSNTYGQLGTGSQFAAQAALQASASLANGVLHKVKNFNSGVADSIDRREGQVVVQDRVFQQISCGSEHSFALSKEGELFAWGLNFKG